MPIFPDKTDSPTGRAGIDESRMHIGVGVLYSDVLDCPEALSDADVHAVIRRFEAKLRARIETEWPMADLVIETGEEPWTGRSSGAAQISIPRGVTVESPTGPAVEARVAAILASLIASRSASAPRR